jgi:hypothetical protein
MHKPFSPLDDVRPDIVREPPLPATGEDVREPPLPSDNGSKDDLPDDGGGNAPRRLTEGEQDSREIPSDEIPENERTGDEPHPRS